MSLSLSKIIIFDGATLRSGTNAESFWLSPFNIHRSRSVGPLEYRGWLRPSREMLTLTFSLSLFLFLSPLLLSVFLSGSFSPSTFPVQPPPVYVRGSRRITASSRGRIALGNNRHGPNILSSPPANQVNPINALGRPQTKKSPPGTLALSRVRYVFVLKCSVLFWSSSPVISAAI